MRFITTHDLMGCGQWKPSEMQALPFVQATTVDLSEPTALGQVTVSSSSPALSIVKPHFFEVWAFCWSEN